MTDTNPELREQIADICRRGYHGIAETKVVNELQYLFSQHEQEANKKAVSVERLKIRQSYAKKYHKYTKSWIADFLGISRPTLDALLKDPEKFTIGTIKKLASLSPTKEKETK